MRLTVRIILVLFTLLLRAAWLPAQVVIGRVDGLSTREPIRGAWVVLMDTAGNERVAALTDSAGRFVLRAPVTGRFRVVARQLGHEDGTSDALDLAAGRREEVRLLLRERALPLSAINVEAERRCDTNRTEGTLAAVLWEEARKALSGVQWTGRAALLSYRIRHFERQLDLTGRKLTETEHISVSRGERPFATPPPEQLAEHGFVQPMDGTFVFYGPDADVLLSDAFADTHCFVARKGSGQSGGLVGLSFEPTAGRRVVDVAGTLWMDTATAALRYLEFRYIGIDYGPRTNEMGGRLDFARLPSGAWITQRWLLRGPVTAGRPRDPSPGRAREPLVGFKETGAQLDAILNEVRTTPSAQSAAPLARVDAASGSDGVFVTRSARSAMPRSALCWNRDRQKRTCGSLDWRRVTGLVRSIIMPAHANVPITCVPLNGSRKRSGLIRISLSPGSDWGSHTRTGLSSRSKGQTDTSIAGHSWRRMPSLQHVAH